MPEEEQGITYSVRDIVDRIDKNITAVKAMLNTKADDVDVVALRAKVQILDADVAVLKSARNDKRWQIAYVILPAIAIIVGVLAIILR